MNDDAETYFVTYLKKDKMWFAFVRSEHCSAKGTTKELAFKRVKSLLLEQVPGANVEDAVVM